MKSASETKLFNYSFPVCDMGPGKLHKPSANTLTGYMSIKRLLSLTGILTGSVCSESLIKYNDDCDF